MFLKRLLLTAALLCTAAAPDFIDNADRPEEDKARDAARHPAELLAFTGLQPGQIVADFIPGSGYFTRIFSNIVGLKGHVYAIVPAELAMKKPQMASAMLTLSQTAPFTNVTPQVQPTAEAGSGDTLDMAWTSDNYHDMFGFFGEAAASAAVQSIFHALKPGGVFIVIDHRAKEGAKDTATTLHRIDPAIVKAQAEAAGFKLEAESDVLKNAADDDTRKIFDPSVRGHTDQFAFKFRKPQ